MMTPPEDKRQVTLEALLRLKRAERPPAEFWVKFEQELRAKQLAAIVQRHPWWRTNPLRGLLRYRLSLGATAIIALSLVSLRQYQAISHLRQSTSPAPAEVAVVATPQASPLAQGARQIALVSSAPLSNLTSADVPSSKVDAEIHSENAIAQVNSTAVMESGVTEATPHQASWRVAAGSSEASDLSPAARSIADNLAAATEAHPELTNRFLSVPSGFEKRVLPAVHQAMVDPLAQMRSPGELHRERLLASASPVAANAGRSSEKIARRIADERLTEEAISRFGARGDRVLVKF